MTKVGVLEAANILGISKEAVYNRIRRGTLATTQINGVKYVLLDEDITINKTEFKKNKQPNLKSSQDSNLYDFIQYLKNEIADLKAQNNILHEQKEQILKDSKIELKQIYEQQDKRMSGFLSALNIPLINNKINENSDTIDVEPLNFEQTQYSKKWISLSDYIQKLNFNVKAAKRAKKLIIRHAGYSKYIKLKDGVIYVRKNKSLNEIIGEI